MRKTHSRERKKKKNVREWQKRFSYMLGKNVIIGSDHCELLCASGHWIKRKEFKIVVNGKTFHLLVKWRVTSKMMY